MQSSRPKFKANSFLHYVSNICPLSTEFVNEILEMLKYKRVEKGAHLLLQGKVCENLYYIKSGLIRAYTEDGDKNITTWISCEEQLVTSIYGFYRQKPSKENIQVMENCKLEYITYNDMRKLLGKYKEMNLINRTLLEKYYMDAEERAFLARLPNASLRYQFLLESNFSFVLSRVAGKYIASFLGIREETYSRMLNKNNNKV